MTSRPPFRADMVGSLLRPVPVKQGRAARERGEMSEAELAAIEDAEIARLVRRQADIGLEAVTDGEVRRGWWHFDFLWGLNGVEKVTGGRGIQFAGIETRAESLRVTGKLSFPASHPHIGHFRSLLAMTPAGKMPKMTIPSPSMLHYRGGRAQVSPAVYPTMDAYFHDLGLAYRQAIAAFHAAGCRYLQLDDVALSYFCDPSQHKMLADRGDEPASLLGTYRDTLAVALANRPQDMVITTHTCRGNFRSTFVASGGYEPVADLVFNAIDVDGYFMEWDDERSGGFEPLRFLPKGKRAVLGLVTSKRGALEQPDDVKRRIDLAARWAPLDQLCLSPQCGFASTEEGNNLTEDEQWRKLELVVAIARDVWRG